MNWRGREPSESAQFFERFPGQVAGEGAGDDADAINQNADSAERNAEDDIQEEEHEQEAGVSAKRAWTFGSTRQGQARSL